MQTLKHLHWRLALALSVAATALCLIWPPSDTVQLALLLLLAGCIGVPHGLTDLGQLSAAGSRFPLPRLAPAICGLVYYLLMLLAVLIVWQLTPAGALLLLLLVSIYHFGSHDMREIKQRSCSRAAIWRHGALIILLPLAAQPQTSDYFQLLSGLNWQRAQPVFVAAAMILVPWQLVWLLQKPQNTCMLAETCTIYGMLIVLPPLLSFTFYFCFWHTPRHYLQHLAAHGAAWLKPSSVITLAMLFVACVGLVFFLLHFETFAVHPSREITLWFFKLLSALAVPHILLSLIIHPQASER
ncbi:MAG: Brp/Blh family beta-carotene 15,15'-dioxygenase [Alphaproteobacteria bacterium]|nr:Brp/Blh family beta-carotene 15,15'-dioxygenase [Alphaproteobacteria bacterium]